MVEIIAFLVLGQNWTFFKGLERVRSSGAGDQRRDNKIIADEFLKHMRQVVQTVKSEIRSTIFDVRYSISGFTLVELLVVLFIITLILGLSGVYFSGSLASVRIDSTGREVLATMRYARSMARTNHEKRILTIDLDAKRYGIEGYGSRDIPQDVRIRVVDPFYGEISNGKYSMVFPATGAARSGTVLLSNNRKELSILTDPVTGSVIKGKES